VSTPRKTAATPGPSKVPPAPGPGLVVGTVPPLARIAGGVAVVAALLLLLAPAFPLATVAGRDLGGPGNLWAFVPPLPMVAAVAAGGVLAALGRLPRLGLAVLFPAGTLAAGSLLQTVALLRTGSHSTLDLPLGIGTSSRYEAGPGLVVYAVGYAMLLLAALFAASAWPRTIMEDGGDLDPRRPRLAAWGLAAGVLTALVLGMAPYSSTIAPGAPTLPERHGLDLLGATVLTLGAAVWSVVAATLRPRLGATGAYLGLAATLLTLGLANALLVARSGALGVSAGGVGVLLAAVAAAALALTTARMGRTAGKA
jgi:iron complex transport system permease protein